jgi:hypothetical protein
MCYVSICYRIIHKCKLLVVGFGDYSKQGLSIVKESADWSRLVSKVDGN